MYALKHVFIQQKSFLTFQATGKISIEWTHLLFRTRTFKKFKYQFFKCLLWKYSTPGFKCLSIPLVNDNKLPTSSRCWPMQSWKTLDWRRFWTIISMYENIFLQFTILEKEWNKEEITIVLKIGLKFINNLHTTRAHIS